jgi:hypothetical protein
MKRCLGHLEVVLGEDGLDQDGGKGLRILISLSRETWQKLRNCMFDSGVIGDRV